MKSELPMPFMFFDEPHNALEDGKLIKSRNVFRGFAVRFRKDDGSAVTPSTMVGHMRSLNRALKMNGYCIDIFKHPLLTDKDDGLILVLENRFANQHSEGALVKHHNTLPRADVIHILVNPIFDPRTSLC